MRREQVPAMHHFLIYSIFFLLYFFYRPSMRMKLFFSSEILRMPVIRRRRRRERSDLGFERSTQNLECREKTAGHSEGMDAPPGPPVDSGLPRRPRACASRPSPARRAVRTAGSCAPTGNNCKTEKALRSLPNGVPLIYTRIIIQPQRCTLLSARHRWLRCSAHQRRR